MNIKNILCAAIALLSIGSVAQAQVYGQPVAGQDSGFNQRTLLTDTTGRLLIVGSGSGGVVYGPDANGTSPTQAPIGLLWDGTDIRYGLTDSSGRQIININGTVGVTQSTSPWVISASSLPLPTGAATSAKQPALGTLGTPSTDVLTVQGGASMTPFQIGGITPGTVAGASNGFPITLYSVAGAIAAYQGNSTDGLATSSAATKLTIDSLNYIFNGTSIDRKRSIQGADQTGLGITAVATSPNSNINTSITPIISTSVESSHILKASAGNMYRVRITSGAVAGFLMLFNATSAPSDGAVTPQSCSIVPANSTVEIDHGGIPDRFAIGITAVFSSTGCFTKTASATAMIEGFIE